MDKKEYFETVVQNQIGYEFKNQKLLNRHLYENRIPKRMVERTMRSWNLLAIRF